MKIIIELIQNEVENKHLWNGWKVTIGDKYADGLAFDEMLGLVATLTVPEEKNSLMYLRTKEQRKQERKKMKEIRKKNHKSKTSQS